MKLSTAHSRLTPVAVLLAATALFPLAASAGTLHHVQSSHIATVPASAMVAPDTMVAALAYSDALSSQQQMQASLDASLREQISEMTRQASLVRKAYNQLSIDLASGDERAIAESQAKLETHQAAFLDLQKNVRANLLQLRQVKNSGETMIN